MGNLLEAMVNMQLGLLTATKHKINKLSKIW